MQHRRTEEAKAEETMAEKEPDTAEIENWLMNSSCALDSFGYPGGSLLYCLVYTSNAGFSCSLAVIMYKQAVSSIPKELDECCLLYTSRCV